MTLSTELLLKHPSSSDITSEELYLHEKFKLPSSSSYPVNSPNTPSLKAPKPSPNSLSFFITCSGIGLLGFVVPSILTRVLPDFTKNLVL